jgi:hypothetical protein
MKRTFLVALGAFLLFAPLVQYGWAADSAPRNKVVLYQDYGCGTGNHLELGVGNYPDLRAYKTGAPGGQDWNDQVSCIAIGSGITKVVVYEHINYGGRSKEITRSWMTPGGNWNVPDEWWNDRISSIKVIGSDSSAPWGESTPRDKAVFYQDDCGAGNNLELGEGRYPDLRAYRTGGSGGQSWNDQISCLTIGSGISKVIVYEHVNFGGESKEFTRSWGGTGSGWSLLDGRWNDRISSIEVIGSGSSKPWMKPVPRDRAVFYDDEGCSGNYVELGEGGYPDLREFAVEGSSSATWNDRISCVKIGSGISKVILYEHPNFEGKSKEFTRSSGEPDLNWSLSGGWSNNKVTSIKVFGSESWPSWNAPAPRDRAVFYQDNCGSGDHLELRKGEYPDLREFRVGGSSSATWNDRISCIVIGPGITKVTVYEHPNFEGKSREFTRTGSGSGSNWSLSGLWCNDKVTSLKVQ